MTEYNRPGYESLSDEQIEALLVRDLVSKALENPYSQHPYDDPDYERANRRLNEALIQIDRKRAEAA